MSDDALRELEECLSRINKLVRAAIDLNAEQKRKLEAGSKNRPKLTPNDVRNIRGMKRAGFSQKQIADSFDVHPATISRIVRGQYHR